MSDAILSAREFPLHSARNAPAVTAVRNIAERWSLILGIELVTCSADGKNDFRIGLVVFQLLA